MGEEITVEVPDVVVELPDENETPAPVVVITPENNDANNDELMQLREYKINREREDAEKVQEVADEALRVANLALELSLNSTVETENVSEEVEEVADEVEETSDEIAPDIAPQREHWFWKKGWF